MQHCIVIHHLSLNLIKYPSSGWVDLIGLYWCAVARCDVCNVGSGSVHCIKNNSSLCQWTNVDYCFT